MGIQFATLQLSKEGSRPTERSWRARRRLPRDFLGAPRLVDVWDPAAFECEHGCRLVRRCWEIARLSHTVSTRSKNQAKGTLWWKCRQLSFAPHWRGQREGLRIMSLLKGTGVDDIQNCFTQWRRCSNGVGRIRHVNTNVLWLREMRLDLWRNTKPCRYYPRTGGKQKPFRCMSKRVGPTLGGEHMAKMSAKNMGGRASVAARTHGWSQQGDVVDLCLRVLTSEAVEWTRSAARGIMIA